MRSAFSKVLGIAVKEPVWTLTWKEGKFEYWEENLFPLSKASRKIAVVRKGMARAGLDDLATASWSIFVQLHPQ